MHAVIISFPGHFFQTHLTMRSLIACYPEVRNITFVLDDVELGPWHQYISDFSNSIRSAFPISFDIKLMSDMALVRDCVAGWWRQQLVKLSVDLLLCDDSWFVIDGDVIFDTRFDIQGVVPISRFGSGESAWAKMCVLYVRNLLGSGPGCIVEDNRKIVTSPIPFRYLDRHLLQGLRQHVEQRYQKNFLQAHLDWFDDQTIVANWDPPDRWVMSEWELIECYRRYVLDEQWSLIDLGSGYGIENHGVSDKKNIFRHAYQRDMEISPQIFIQNGQDVDTVLWNRARTWYEEVEKPLRR
jgi:hypothetical protein